MNAIERGKGKIMLTNTLPIGVAVEHAREVVEQTAKAYAVEVLELLVKRIGKNAEYTKHSDALENIARTAESTGKLLAAGTAQELMSELRGKS